MNWITFESSAMNLYTRRLGDLLIVCESDPTTCVYWFVRINKKARDNEGYFALNSHGWMAYSSFERVWYGWRNYWGSFCFNNDHAIPLIYLKFLFKCWSTQEFNKRY